MCRISRLSGTLNRLFANQDHILLANMGWEYFSFNICTLFMMNWTALSHVVPPHWIENVWYWSSSSGRTGCNGKGSRNPSSSANLSKQKQIQTYLLRCFSIQSQTLDSYLVEIGKWSPAERMYFCSLFLWDTSSLYFCILFEFYFIAFLQCISVFVFVFYFIVFLQCISAPFSSEIVLHCCLSAFHPRRCIANAEKF